MENTFYVLSDPQVGHEQQEKRMHIKRDILLKEGTKKDVLIVPGDITQYGIGNMNNPFTKYLCMCICIRRQRGESVDKWSNELPRFKETFMKPVEEKLGNTLLCIGNHDSLTQWWIGHNPVYEYVRNRHGGLNYKKEIDGIVIFSLSEYPNAHAVKWLKTQLEKEHKTEPFIVFFHFNLEGPYSDWWTSAEKDAFYKVVEPYLERLAFVGVGHVHWSNISNWRGIKVVNGAGDALIRVKVTRSVDNKLVSVEPTYMFP